MKPVLTCAFMLLPVLLLPVAAQATPLISGSFTGTTSNAMTTGPDGRPKTLDGTPVTGSFSADATNCFRLDAHTPDTAISCSVSFDALGITINANDRTFAVARPLGLISVLNTASSQILTLTAGFTFEAFNATLRLSGPPNAFIDGIDFQTLHAGPVDPRASALFLGARSSFSGAIRLNAVSLNEVPEPATWMLLAGGLMAGWVIRAVGVRFKTSAQPL